jgi:hypothetical protein
MRASGWLVPTCGSSVSLSEPVTYRMTCPFGGTTFPKKTSPLAETLQPIARLDRVSKKIAKRKWKECKKDISRNSFERQSRPLMPVLFHL